MKDLTVIDIFEDKIIFPSKVYTVGDKGIPWLKINFKYLFGLQTLNGLKIEVKYDLPKGFVLDEYTLDINNSTELSINSNVFLASGWVKIFITLKKDTNNLITVPGEISLRVRNLNIDNSEVAPVYEVLIQKAVSVIDSKINEAILVANKKIEEIKTTEGMIGPQGPQGESNLNINCNQSFETWLGTLADYEAIVKKNRGILYNWFDESGNFVGGYYKKKLTIPMDGLTHWLDARDGNVGEDFLTDRVEQGLKVPIYGLNHDANSGFVGNSLKLDGINDWIFGGKTYSGYKSLVITFSLLKATNGINYIWTSHHEMPKPIPQLNYDGRLSGPELIGRFTWVKDTRVLDVSYIMAVLTYTPDLEGNLKRSGYIFNKEGLVVESLDEATLENIEYNCQILIGRQNTVENRFCNIGFHSLLTYNRPLSKSEIEQIYTYEKDIDRTTPITYSQQEECAYGIGLVDLLTKEQVETFRLSNDKSKFVAGLRYCIGKEVKKYTYSEIQKIMETEEWKSKEIEV